MCHEKNKIKTATFFKNTNMNQARLHSGSSVISLTIEYALDTAVDTENNLESSKTERSVIF